MERRIKHLGTASPEGGFDFTFRTRGTLKDSKQVDDRSKSTLSTQLRAGVPPAEPSQTLTVDARGLCGSDKENP